MLVYFPSAAETFERTMRRGEFGLLTETYDAIKRACIKGDTSVLRSFDPHTDCPSHAALESVRDRLLELGYSAILTISDGSIDLAIGWHNVAYQTVPVKKSWLQKLLE